MPKEEMRNSIIIRVLPGGGFRLLYTEEFPFEELGEGVEIRRASYVDPLPGGGWMVDLRPSGGPVITGHPVTGRPFSKRSEALLWEQEWLIANML
jgi:hypothetical protein